MPKLNRYEFFRPVPKVFRIKEAAAKIYQFEEKTGIALSQPQIDNMSKLMIEKNYNLIA